MAFTRRLGRVQPFLRSNDREDGRYGGLQAGFVTYHGEPDAETYLVTYAELGGRSDHVSRPLSDIIGADVSDLSTASPLESDADLMRAPEKDDQKEAAEASA